MRKYLVTFLMILSLLFTLPARVHAAEVPDLDQRGSITVSVHLGNEAVSGGTMTLYRVGDVVENEGDYSFIPTENFAGWGDTFSDIESPEVAKSLADYEHKLSGETKEINAEGQVKFEDLEPGLYLVVQDEAAEGYSKANPFLVSLPYWDEENSVYVYDVDGRTKAELIREVEKESSKGGSTSGSGSSGHSSGKLPQTGQLWWPVPMLIFAGLLCIVVGLIRRRGTNHGK